MTGFGNFSFFYTKRDYSFVRFWCLLLLHWFSSLSLLYQEHDVATQLLSVLALSSNEQHVHFVLHLPAPHIFLPGGVFHHAVWGVYESHSGACSGVTSSGGVVTIWCGSGAFVPRCLDCACCSTLCGSLTVCGSCCGACCPPAHSSVGFAMLCLQSVSCWLAGAKYGVTHEWHFRSFLDHWDSAFGMMFALNFPVWAANSCGAVGV